MIVNLTGRVEGWPAGARLRFRLDAELQAKYQYLRGTEVVVEGPPHLISPRDGKTTWEVRQNVWSCAFNGHGWANPFHLEPLPDAADRPQMVSRSEWSPSAAPYDPIEAAVKSHPGLTTEEAEEMAREFGF